MKNSLETRLGIFVVLVVIAAVVIIETLGGWQFYQHGYRVSALFDTVQELKVGDSVKMAGVEIGRVEKIALDKQQGPRHHEAEQRDRGEDGQPGHHQIHRIDGTEFCRH